ncbi:hypothetical protein ABIE61_003740 [Marinobacterium sp. MBR-111]|jgi:hypothetical protein|uniref:hypothetical protein n=1 Tax=Marinobacterium sp. MBR-111 TaxID=3156463 RepID=UPI003396B2D7
MFTVPADCEFPQPDNTRYAIGSGFAGVTLADIQHLFKRFPIVLSAEQGILPELLIDPKYPEALKGYVPEIWDFKMCTLDEARARMGAEEVDSLGLHESCMILCKNRSSTAELTFELLTVLEQAQVLISATVYHLDVTSSCRVVQANLLKQRRGWFNQQALGPAALQMAESLLHSQQHLIRCEGVLMTETGYQNWLNPGVGHYSPEVH